MRQNPLMKALLAVLMGRELVILEADLQVGVEQEQLVFRRQGQIIRRAKLIHLERLILLGRQELSASARLTLLKRGIDVVFLNGQGRYQGRLLGPISANGPLRLAQYRVSQDPVQSLMIACEMVLGKVYNQRQFLLRKQREYPDAQAQDSLAAMRLLSERVRQSTGHEQLLGYEGQMASLYFRALPQFIQAPGFVMQGRSKRPPRDNVNAVLSFGYTILTQLAESALWQVGLDPYLGLLHQPRQGFAALVSDLVEEFRPVLVDSLVLRLINRQQLQPGDFYHPDEAMLAEAILMGDASDNESESDPRPAVFLNDTGRRVFFQGWHARLRERVNYPAQNRRFELREIIRQQAYHLARVIQGEDPLYVPFMPR